MEFVWAKEMEKIEPFHRERVLVADDNDLNVDVLKMILEDKGLCVDVVYNGEDAVKRYLESEEGEYQVILLDINMAGGNGYEAAKQIRGAGRSDSQKVAICAVSADILPEHRKKAMAVGMNHYITKPVDYAELFQFIHMALAGEGGGRDERKAEETSCEQGKRIS